jgi:hypothetical protein
MARQTTDEDLLGAVRDFEHPVRFGEIADALAARGITRSQVHPRCIGWESVVSSCGRDRVVYDLPGGRGLKAFRSAALG